MPSVRVVVGLVVLPVRARSADVSTIRILVFAADNGTAINQSINHSIKQQLIRVK